MPRFRFCFLDSTDHKESLLGEVIVQPGYQFLEAANSVFKRNKLTLESGELLRDMKGLRKEALNLSCASYSQLILFRQLIYSENCYDVLEVLIAL